MVIVNEYDYTEADLISFAEYCLERSRLNNGDLRHLVYYADLMNWMEKKKPDMFKKKKAGNAHLCLD